MIARMQGLGDGSKSFALGVHTSEERQRILLGCRRLSRGVRCERSSTLAGAENPRSEAVSVMGRHSDPGTSDRQR